MAAVVLEPTGGYEVGVALWAHARGWPVCLPNPRQVRDWARSQGRRWLRAKTDGQDALLLAPYGAPVHPPHWQPLAQEVSDLEQLLRRRRDDVAARLQQERTRLQQVQARPGLPAAVRSRQEPSGAVWSRLEPSGAVRSRLEPSGAVWHG